MTLTAFLAIAGLTLLGAVSPGPAVLMSARTGLAEGFRTGAMLAIGIGAGAVFWACAAMFGLNILFEFAPDVLWAFKILGGAYLVWMGWKLWQSGSEPLDISDARPVPRSAPSASSAFIKASASSLTFMMPTTGPKDSSIITRILWVTLVRICGAR